MKDVGMAYSDVQERDIIHSLAEIYYSMHLIDLTKDVVVEYYARDKVKEYVNQVENAREQMFSVMANTVVPEYKEKALGFTDLFTVAQRMKGKRIISQEFVGKTIGWFRAYFIAVEVDKKEKPEKVFFVTQIIDKEKQKEEDLIQKSNTDELTGLYNRRAYKEELIRLHTKKIEDDFVFISLDVNGLKEINDNFGHVAGDELLKGASRCIMASVGKYGKIYRTGGDEFVAMIVADEKTLANIQNDLQNFMRSWKGESVNFLWDFDKKGSITRYNSMGNG